MYHIAVLTKSETQEIFYTEQLSRFCSERGLFPKVDCYRGQEVFFEVARKNAPTNAVISLPGVDGLNAVEHLRALFPETRIIWCSELDLYCRQLPAGRSIDPVNGSLQRSTDTGNGGGRADAFRHCNTGCHSRTCRGNDPFRAGYRRTPREGLAAQAGRRKPLHGKE